jgi:hypothetical protein
VHAGDQLGRGRQQHPGLAERGQDLLDVPEEDRAGPDDEHAAAGDPVPVGVQQVGGPVQGHRGLAGARPALHDEHAVQRRAHDGVLLGLQGRHDVAHVARAVRGQRGHQGAVTGDRDRVGLQRGRVEHVVVDAGDPPVPGGQVTAAGHAVRGRGGRLVERARRRRAPVHEQLRLLLVRQPDPPDVAALAAQQVQAPERQPVLHRGQLPQPLAVQVVEGLPLGPPARGGDERGLPDLFERALRLLAFRVEGLIQAREVGLLQGHLALHVRGTQGPASSPRPALDPARTGPMRARVTRTGNSAAFKYR